MKDEAPKWWAGIVGAALLLLAFYLSARPMEVEHNSKGEIVHRWP